MVRVAWWIGASKPALLQTDKTSRWVSRHSLRTWAPALPNLKRKPYPLRACLVAEGGRFVANMQGAFMDEGARRVQIQMALDTSRLKIKVGT